MSDNATCLQHYRMESYDANHKLVVSGHAHSPVPSADKACVFVLDLATIHPQAVGFRRGFIRYPYGYLSAGEHDVLVRLDLVNFGIASTRIIAASSMDSSFGGYSGGFADGSWACFCPYKTFTGPVGGLRSSLPADTNHLRPYYNPVMLCVNSTVWDLARSDVTPSLLGSQAYALDFSIVDITLRGYSDAVRSGRYAFLSPLASADHVYTSKLIRIDLGDVDIGSKIAQTYAAGGSIRDMVDVLDLAMIDNRLRGFSGLFTSGNYLFLVPFRNAYEPRNGQRGHGVLTRLDMNEFSTKGVDYSDVTVATRQQVPSFQDLNLRGFSAGFASGKYGLLVPFFNGNFHGKVGRFQTMDPVKNLNASVQELDLTIDSIHRDTYKGYRGGFVSIWQGVVF
mmetsp:Transcript_10360/g.15572  ORF Transcript_10360/g.15572 Transcript_10360/m.15572 type:complete len:395 (+) Transcript_10360:306-1490(+)